jgi:hypothetical protein
MPIGFSSICRSNGVEIALIERGLFRNRLLEPNVWKSSCESVAPITRRLLPLVDEGLANWVDSKLLITNEIAAEFHESFASTLGLPSLAPIMLDISFHGRIGEPGSYVIVEWKDTNYRVLNPSRSGIQITWGGQVGRLIVLRHEIRRLLLLNLLTQHGHLGSILASATIK